MKSRPGHLVLALTYLGFVSLGLREAAMGVAWPSVRDTFALPQTAFGAIFIASAAGYFTSSFFTGRLKDIMGIGALLLGGSALVTAGLAGYTLTPFWFVFVACALITGLGSGALDSGMNAYGASHFSPSHMNWMHAAFGVGATVGPLIMTGVLAQGWSWRWGYAAALAVFLFMTGALVWTRRSWDDPPGTSAKDDLNHSVSMRAALKHPAIWLQGMLFFIYTGLEVAAGQWAFTLYTESRDVEVSVAGIWVSVYWASLAAGRILFGFVVKKTGILPLLRLAMGGALAGALLFALPSHNLVSFIGFALMGLSLAPIFPSLMADTPRRMGAGYAAHAVGFQVSAAVVGAAVLPSLAGFLGQRFGLEAIVFVIAAVAATQVAVHELLVRLNNRRANNRHWNPRGNARCL